MMRQPMDRQMLASAVVFLLGIFWTELTYVGQQPVEVSGGGVGVESVPLVAGTCVALLLPLNVVHEMGHALAARLMGARVLSVQIGAGQRQLLRMRVGGVELVALSRLLDGGQTTWLANGLGRPRQAVMVAAGPMTNLLVLCAALFTLPRVSDWRLDALVVVNTAVLVANLIPTGRAASRRNDGRLLADVVAGSLHRRDVRGKR